MSVTSRYCVKTAAQIELLFGTRASLGLFYSKIRVLVPNSGLRNLATACPSSPSGIKATVVGLLLTTLGDGGRSQVTSLVVSTVDRRSSRVDNTQRPALCTARSAIGHGAARRAGHSASAETCNNALNLLVNLPVKEF